MDIYFLIYGSAFPAIFFVAESQMVFYGAYTALLHYIYLRKGFVYSYQVLKVTQSLTDCFVACAALPSLLKQNAPNTCIYLVE